MGNDQREILALPSSTQSRLRSTQILISLPQLVSELVQNSIDAGARSIDVSVNCEDWECYVSDDGGGIHRDGLALLARGPDAGRYGTSKVYDAASLDRVSTFGFRGEALASVADLACLEISSRTNLSRESWSVILKGGQTLYAGPSTRWRREAPGTVVCVRDAFYNLPIRRRSHTSPSRTLELVRKEIEKFALVCPEVSFTLEDAHKASEGGSSKSKARVLTVPKTRSTLMTFRHLFGRALAEHVEEIDEMRDGVRLNGFISLDGTQSKAHQFLYVNKHPLAPCELHYAVETVFARSSFGKHAYDEYGETTLPRSAARRSPRKSEKKPVFVLDFTVPMREVDNCLEPAKAAVHLQNSNSIATFLSSVVESVLAKHGFLTARRPSPEFASPRKRRKLEHRPLKVARSPSRPSPDPAGEPSTRHDISTPTREHAAPVVAPTHGDMNLGDPPNIIWTDPRTGETFVVDARTGNSYPQCAPGNVYDDDATAAPARRARRTLEVRTESGNGPEAPAWIRKALAANDSYVLTERKIPALVPTLASRENRDIFSSQGWDPSSGGEFTASDLRAARVLGQVDRKFIACVIGANTLVLIDQHAAHERVRVEGFFKELCAGFLAADGEGVRMTRVDPPVEVLLTSHEAARLARDADVREAFSAWGIRFAEPPTHEVDGAYVQVAVDTVPAVVGEKLLAGDELRDVVQGHLAVLDGEGPGASQRVGEEAFWQRALRQCPRGLVELVNSKACRGAIMFNDSLTREQCERLVRDLAECALPFQCAHGRPSLVPIVDTAAEERGPQRGREVDWAAYSGSQ